MRTFKWLNEHLEEAALVGLLIMISCVMLAQVVARYVLNDSMSWPEEFCRYCYIWTMFLSLGYTMRRGNMLRVGVVMDMLPTILQNAVQIVVKIATFALFMALFRQSFKTVYNIKNVTGEISSAMQVPMWIMYLSAPIGFGLALIRTIQSLADSVQHFSVRSRSAAEEVEEEAEEAISEALHTPAQDGASPEGF